jgi:hypothetical protein
VKVRLDHCVPRALRNAFGRRLVETGQERGWSTLRNGELLDAAEAAGFAAPVTVDRRLPAQQNIARRHIGVVGLCGASIRAGDRPPLAPAALVGLETLSPGAVVRIEPPP